MLAHWDDVDLRRREVGEMAASWQRLGDVAGTVRLGVNRVRVDPERLSTPPHSHGASEELVYVLGGSGLSWQDEKSYEIGPGDCIVHLADHEEHTLRGGADGLDALVFGTRHPTELGWLPRSASVRLGWPWVEGRTDDPWEIEAQAGPLAFAPPAPRPPNIVNVSEVGADTGGVRKPLAAAAGSVLTGLNRIELPPGTRGAPPHCHSADEEAFVILDGDGMLELWPSPVAADGAATREDIAVRAGHVVARPPGTKIAHSFVAGERGLTFLAYGTREPDDVAYYPRSHKIYWRGLGVIGRVEHLEYADGEPD